jgi:glycosyltransferase involved in cell wall biosynthesis
MNIIYLTTALKDEDYEAFLKMGLSVSNPSNQNFHSKFIKALQTKDNVVVLSLISFPTKGVRALNSDQFHYVDYPDDYFEKIFSRKSEVITIAESFATKFDCLVYDPLNLSLAKAAPILAKKWNIPSIAILTDNPKNLSSASLYFSRNVFASVKKAAGVIALSDGLIKAFHAENKPSLTTEGIVEKMSRGEVSFPKGSYIFFAGSLMPRYGVQDLIEAYLKTKPDYELIIAGHQGKPLLQGENEPRIHYLGQLTKSENYLFEENAALLVNPRPYDDKLDKESIPSKVLEYLSSGAPVLSTRHSKLQELFPGDINWLTESGEGAFERFFESHLDQTKRFVNLRPNNSNERLFNLYGISKQGERIHLFLEDAISLSNKSITLGNVK